MNLKRCPHCHRSLRGNYKDSISSLIKGLGITKTKFAEDLGTSRWLVHQWINGKVNPGQEYITRIEKVYNFVIRPSYPPETGSGQHHSAVE
jgi:DNA-binding transcriptional regulator YiaG